MNMTLGTFFALCLGAFYLWQNKRNEKRAFIARERIMNDNVLYQHIKTGLREFHWKKRHEPDFFGIVFDANNGQLLFEDAHLCIYKVIHFAEFRLGFYFKDIKQYGLYGSFDGFEKYYRTDSDFKKEELLYYDEDDDIDEEGIDD
jgi:hypothetical protein